MTAVLAYKPHELEREAQRVDRTPTEPQKLVGNYRKGHITVHGLDISIETPHGAQRTGTEPDGTPWSVTMPYSYGYIRRTTGADGEQVDVIVGPDHASDRAFVVDQVRLDGTWDEHKCFLGFAHPSEVAIAYDAMFSDGSGPERRRDIHPMSIPEFKHWLAHEDTSVPLAKQALAIANRLLKSAWDESQHPRNEKGEFADSGRSIVSRINSALGGDLPMGTQVAIGVGAGIPVAITTMGAQLALKARSQQKAERIEAASVRRGKITAPEVRTLIREAHGRGIERAILLKPTGELGGIHWGEESSVKPFIGDFQRGAVSIHTHPKPGTMSPPSPPDIGQMLRSGSSDEVHSATGTIYRYSPGPKWRALRSGAVQSIYDKSMERAMKVTRPANSAAIIDEILAGNYKPLRVAKNQVTSMVHGTLLGLADAGIINYSANLAGGDRVALRGNKSLIDVARGISRRYANIHLSSNYPERAIALLEGAMRFAVRAGLRKYDQSEARVPAGQQDGGEFSAGGGAGATAVTAPEKKKKDPGGIIQSATKEVAAALPDVGTDAAGDFISSHVVGPVLNAALPRLGVSVGVAEQGADLAAGLISHGLQSAMKILALVKYDESEARDEKGRWTGDGAKSDGGLSDPEKALLGGAVVSTIVGGAGALAPHTKGMIVASRRAIAGNAQKAWDYFKRGGRLVRGKTTGTPAPALDKLSRAERGSLDSYVGGSRHMNTLLRQGGLENVLKSSAEEIKVAGPGFQEYVTENYKNADKKIRHIDTALSRARQHDPMIVLRGITGGRRDLAKGDVLHDPGFLSTTTNHSTASLFARHPGNEGLLAVIHVPDGIGALNLVKAGIGLAGESEILLERGLNFVVDEVIGHTAFLHAYHSPNPALALGLARFVKFDAADGLAKFIDVADADAHALLRKAAESPTNAEQSLAGRMASALAWIGDSLSGAVSSAAGSVESAVNALPVSAITTRLHRALSVVDPVFMGSAEGVSSRRPKIVAVDFDQRNAQVRDFLANYKMDLIQQITDSQQQTIHQIVSDGLAAGLPPAEMARNIRDGLGLTSYQAQNVLNFRDELENINDPGNATSALSRELRDQRYDRSIQNAITSGSDIPDDQVDTMVDAYKRRYIAYRATTIARTEALRASNLGAVAAAQSLIDSGDVPEGSDIRKTWIATKDNRTRETHRELDGQSVIGMDTPFASSSGAQLLYPHDPAAPAGETVNCRCSLSIDVVPTDGTST